MVGPRIVAQWRRARIETTRLQVEDIAYGAFPAWQLDHPELACPEALKALAHYVRGKSFVDSWGSVLAMRCGDSAPSDEEFGALSAGPDQREETPDDIRSWDRERAGAEGM